MINGANMLDRDELIEHLQKTLTVSWTEYARGMDEEQWQERYYEDTIPDDQRTWWLLFVEERNRLARAYGQRVRQGPAHRWTAGESIFYTWPVE